MAPTILIAEDDTNLRQGLTDLLESEGYTVLAAANGRDAMTLYDNNTPDLLLLDVMMPEMSGYDVCRRVRQHDKDLPIIMLTAKGEEIDKVVGLELGADDYITKPFGLHELRARIKAVLRRAQPTTKDSPPEKFTFGSASIDCRRLEVTLAGQTSRLSARELKLLKTFHSHPGEVLSRDALLNAAWGVDYQGTTRTLDQHIAQLRKKVENNPEQPQAIQTAHGIGYRYAGPL